MSKAPPVTRHGVKLLHTGRGVYDLTHASSAYYVNDGATDIQCCLCVGGKQVMLASAGRALPNTLTHLMAWITRPNPIHMWRLDRAQFLEFIRAPATTDPFVECSI